MKTFVFPGQGSQARGMGADLFDAFGTLTEKANDILGYSIKELCLEDPRRELNKTQHTQPALYVVNALTYYRKVQEGGELPDYLAGHSLGEFNALLAAEAFSFEDGLKMVKKRGELMATASAGGMAAILNGTKEQIETILNENGLTETDFANFNTASQIVISGPRKEIIKAENLFRKDGMEYYPLNTSGAFHSRHMNAARTEFEKYIGSLSFSKLKIPVISNVAALPYENDRIAENLSRQMTHAVKWSDSVVYLLDIAQSSGTSMEFEEIGHGNVLSKMIDKIRLAYSDSSGEARKPSLATAIDKTMPGASPIEHTDDLASVEKATSDAREKANVWNSRYPIGTKVVSSILKGEIVETRTEALVLFGHRAAIYMTGFNGYFDLDEISPA